MRLGGHGLVRRVDPRGDTLMWCRKCPGFARTRLKLLKRCLLEESGTDKYERMRRRVLKWENGVQDDHLVPSGRG